MATILIDVYKRQGISFEERTRMLKEDRETFDKMVDETLRRHFHVIKELVARGTYFFEKNIPL